MLLLTYVGENTGYQIGFDTLNKNVVRIRGELPAQTNGFTLSREGKKDGWDYTDYTTVYRELEGEIQFSKDGSVYVEPVPKVSFHTNGGGTLEGDTVQEVHTYEELEVPIPVAGENYEFTQWSPEIPESGEVEGNRSFTAIFTSTLPEPEPEPTLEERVTTLESDVKSINDAIGGEPNE